MRASHPQRFGVNATSVAVHLSVTAWDVRNQTSQTDVEVTLDWTAPSMGDLTVRSLKDQADVPPSSALSSRRRVQLLLGGGADDPDTEEVRIQWSFAINGQRVDPPPCSVVANGTKSSWSWTAYCSGLPDGSDLCFTAQAFNPVNLSSPSSTACISMDNSPPAWAAESPTLELHDATRFLLQFSTPTDHSISMPIRTAYQLCTQEECGEPAVATQNRTFILKDNPFLVNKSGFVYVIMHATNALGLTSMSARTQMVPLGRGQPVTSVEIKPKKPYP